MKLSLAIDVITTTFLFLPTLAKISEKDETALRHDLKTSNLGGRSLSIDADWTQLGNTLEGKEANVNDQFGSSVSMSKQGTRVAVGAYNDNGSGSVKIYDIAGNSSRQIGDAINGNSQVYSAQFGRVVSMSDDGSRVAIAATGNSNLVEVYEWDFTNNLGQWNRIGSIVPVLGPFALAMSGDGNRFVAGSSDYSANYIGAAYIYEWFGDDWRLIGEFSGKRDYENFGNGVAMSYDGKKIIAGSPYNLSTNPDGGAGYARVYEETGIDKWEQVGVDLAVLDLVDGDYFGYSVGISKSGDRVVVGAPGANRAYVYDLVNSENSAWKLVWNQIGSGGFSRSVSMSDDGKRFASGVGIFEELINGWGQVGSRNYIDGSVGYSDVTLSLSSDGMTVAVGSTQPYGSKLGITALYYSPYPACRNSQLQMILRTSDGDTVPFYCKQAPRFKSGFFCSETSDLASHCPYACGACSEYQCSDSKATFLVGKNEKDCAWLEKMKPSKRDARCSKQWLANTCRKTCNICGGE